MAGKRVGEEAKGKASMRALVRRGSRSDRGPAVVRRTGALRGTTMCERCGATYREKQWHRPAAEQSRWPIALAWTVCPACRQVEDGEYYGRVILRGEAVGRNEEAIRRRVENVAERARWTQPLRRLVSVQRQGDGLEILTTSQKLAHRLVRALASAFGGTAAYGWSDVDGELRAVWTWEGGPTPRVVPSVPASKRAGAGGSAKMDLEIQSRHADVDPTWRSLVERSAARWAGRHDLPLRVHVTLEHGRHRHGAEHVAIVATYPRNTLRVEKEGESMEDAIHAACSAMDREMLKIKDARHALAKASRARA